MRLLSQISMIAGEYDYKRAYLQHDSTTKYDYR